MSNAVSFTSLEAFGAHWFATHPEQCPAEQDATSPCGVTAEETHTGAQIPALLSSEHVEESNAHEEAHAAMIPVGLPPISPADGAPAEGASRVNGALGALLAQLETASLTLARVLRQDQEARSLALRDLERYEAAVAAQQEAETALRRAEQERSRAETVVQTAFAEEARTEAAQVLTLATQLAEAAGRLAEERRAEVAQLASRPELQRLLEERRREEEAEKARVAAARQAERLSAAVAGVREALAAGHLEEAKSRLGAVASHDPNCSEVHSLKQIIARRESVVKTTAAEAALRAVRGELRRQPAAVIARLEALDVVGLPEPLSREIFGRWLRAWADQCALIGIDEPVRYAPEQGRGIVLARDTAGGSDGLFKVLGALGMGPRWQAGCPVGPAVVRRARPLR